VGLKSQRYVQTSPCRVHVSCKLLLSHSPGTLSNK